MSLEEGEIGIIRDICEESKRSRAESGRGGVDIEKFTARSAAFGL
jgi:hypothetical protein